MRGSVEGEEFVQSQIEQARQGRAILGDALSRSPRARFVPPAGAFYLFFSIDADPGTRRHPDTRKLGYRLVDEAGIGIAPGTAFGPAGEDFIRVCFARKADDMHLVAGRMTAWLESAALA